MAFTIGILGFAVLVLMTVVLFASGLYTILNLGFIPLAIVKALIIAALLYEKRTEWITSIADSRKELMEGSYNYEDFWNGFSVFAGTLVTFLLSVDFGLGAVVAAGLVGVASTVIFPKYDVPLYCGSFVGMACGQHVYVTYFHIVVAGLLAALVFVASRDSFDGFGGKLGTIAFAGCVGAALLLGRQLISDPVPGWEVSKYLIIYSILGAVLTFMLNERLGHSAVISSGLVGLTGGLLLPVMYPGFGGALAVMVICASFAGMSSMGRIPNEGVMALAGIFCALVFIYTSPYLGGAGGKLGTIAFGSVISLHGMMRVHKKLTAMLS